MQANAPQADAAAAVGNVMFFQWFGGAILTCVAKTVFTSSIGPALATAAPGVDASTVIYSGATALKSLVPEREWPGVLEAYNQSISHVFVRTPFSNIECLLPSRCPDRSAVCEPGVDADITVGSSNSCRVLCFCVWVGNGLEKHQGREKLNANRQEPRTWTALRVCVLLFRMQTADVRREQCGGRRPILSMIL